MNVFGRAETWASFHPAYVRILGVRFGRLTMRQVVEQVFLWIQEQSRRMIITAGPEFVMMAQRDPAVMEVAQRADLVTPDGIGIVLAAKWRGQPLPERVTGVELALEILATAQQRGQGLRVYVLGAHPDALAACLARFAREFPALTFRGHHGYFDPPAWPKVLDDIRAFAPHLWLVGLGQPRQELLIFQSLHSLPPCVAMGVGGAIDVWSGRIKRAPALFRRLNLEWLYRLLRQPSRWRRQLALPRFVWHVLRHPDRGA
ncbi:N-acetylmannosaminyltransferase [Alicyclobacillus cellulosilyticus]|uniref:N-acetylmannosaminyltransferase n=1 Tax=Alicyclobacillus cellulosilyticus TaxID=1003997 RepID=A0A917NJG8_9BACL|nr:WecB/TagA/CpsF family glycosyltransferase [Alicyclobacillus cellulosilyticus]GGJ05237.1 N-acetylmannosaminyltransferase [Alicyclobacillus cellulosilyticus]